MTAGCRRPPGVPVKIRSPGSSSQTDDRWATSSGSGRSCRPCGPAWTAPRPAVEAKAMSSGSAQFVRGHRSRAPSVRSPGATCPARTGPAFRSAGCTPFGQVLAAGDAGKRAPGVGLGDVATAPARRPRRPRSPSPRCPRGAATVLSGPVIAGRVLGEDERELGRRVARLGRVRRVVERDREHLARVGDRRVRGRRGRTGRSTSPRAARRAASSAPAPRASDGEAPPEARRRRAPGRRDHHVRPRSVPELHAYRSIAYGGVSCAAATGRRGCAAGRRPRSRPRPRRRAGGRSRTGRAGPPRRPRWCRW